MGLFISISVIVVLVFFILKSIVSFSLKVLSIGVILAISVCTIWICSVHPDIHKPFSINTIEYLFKINKDGSMTTTKQITTTGVYKK